MLRKGNREKMLPRRNATSSIGKAEPCLRNEDRADRRDPYDEPGAVEHPGCLDWIKVADGATNAKNTVTENPTISSGLTGSCIWMHAGL